jgi:WD domain, G-beta repeat
MRRRRSWALPGGRGRGRHGQERPGHLPGVHPPLAHARHPGADDPSPEAARRNLAAQLIGRWKLEDAAPGGLLSAEHDSPVWFKTILDDAAHAARTRAADQSTVPEPVAILVDGIDEAPAPVPGFMPLGLPKQLPPGVAVILTSRPGVPLPAGLPCVRIDVESALNQADLLHHLQFITSCDKALADALDATRLNRDGFCQALVQRSGGIWIYALSVLDQIRQGGRAPTEVDTLPAGLAAYYASNIQRWRADPTIDWDHELAPLLGTLAAAREARTTTSLAGWTGIPEPTARALIQGPLRAFLVPRRSDRTRLYALRRQSLREFSHHQLSDHADEQLHNTAEDLATHTHAAHRPITDALTPPRTDGVRRWEATVDATYARLHVAHRAAESNRLADLVNDPDFLLFAPLPELQRFRARAGAGAAAIAAVEMAANSWPSDRAGKLHWLHVSALRMQSPDLTKAIDARMAPGWRPIAATWPGPSHQVLTGHTDTVCSVAFGTLTDGRTLLATGSADGTVGLWDPATGTSVGQLLTGYTDTVRSAVFGPSADGGTSVAFGTLADGRTLLATGSDDGTVRLWDPTTGGPIGQPLTGHTRRVTSVAFGTRPDGCVLLAASGDLSVLLWDPATGTPSANPSPATAAGSVRWPSLPCPTAASCWLPAVTTARSGSGTPPLAPALANPSPGTPARSVR